MKNIFNLLVLSLLIIFVGSCRSKSRTAETPKPDMHTSQIALDWEGVYAGILPCADCEGIQTMIRINDDMTFSKETIYKGKSHEVYATQGTFSWHESGNKIILEYPDKKGTTLYAVGENHLAMLDKNGSRISGDLATNYILQKDMNSLSEKQWKLIELNGKMVIRTEGMRRDPFIIFRKINQSVYGNGSCNTFHGTYTTEEGNRISFSKIASTKMLCGDMDVETRFFQVLEQVDSFYISEGDTLILSKEGMAPLAKFIVAETREQ